MTARRLIALLSVLFLVPLIAVTTQSPSASAAGGGLFQPLPAFSPSAVNDASVRPSQFKAYRADLAGLRAQLASGRTTLTIPDPAGTATEFSVAEDSVMEPKLQAAHPDIRTYAGAAANGTTIRLDVTPFGFHAMVRRPDGVSWYVEPATANVGEDRVLSFAGAAAGTERETFVEKQVQGAAQEVAPDVDESFSTPGGVVTQRTFRLAFITDPTYAAFVAPGAATHAASDPLVLAAKVSLINRVNEAYNDDVAYKFLLVTGTDTKLNLLNAAEATGTNGPCGASACFTASQVSGCGSSTLTRNNFVLGMLIGADNFDIGHIGFGLNGGGVAGLGVVGGSSKASGCTGLPQPIGDVYAIDYVAHEMGHQMGGNHTFNGTQVNCSGGNRNGATSVEPGSGSSIQAYAGICGSDDLQPHSDPYFSFRSIDEFEATTATVRTNLSEQQVVSFTGLDAGEQMTITCATGCTPANATFTGVGAADAAAIAAAINTATGSAATVTGYDANALPVAAGFTATWAALADQQRLIVTPATGSFTASTGVRRNGGPQTNGGTTAVTTNHSPVVVAPVDKTIPTRTPFTLTGSATDADADTLTYLWEQTDAGGASGTGLVSNTKTNGPLFRVFGVSAQVSASDTLLYHSPGENLAGTDPSRTFPDLTQILAGNTNAASGTCPAPAAGGTVPVTDPALNCFSEFLPTSAWLGTGDRVLHFRLTARDEFTPDGPADDPGGVSWDNLALTVDPAAGPFLVTSRATAGSPASGPETVTWNVAGTAGAALAPNVKISLSTDGGLTYPTVLAATTPNDGSEVVTLPNINTTTARIKVEAVDNYFFDINDANFTIQPAGPNTPPTVDAGPDGAATTGSPFTSSGSFDDDHPESVTATVDYGDGGGAQPLTLDPVAKTFALNHTYATPGTKTVTVVVTDASAETDTDTATVTVTTPANTPPTVNAGPDGTATTGSPFTSSGSYNDDVPATVTATVDYGDGGGPQPLTLNTVAKTFSLSHTYATAGSKTVTVVVTDAGALTATDTATVTVSAGPSTAPSAIVASAKPKKITQGHGFKVKATVTTASGVPAGVVKVYLGTKLLGTGTLKSDGKVTIKISAKKAKKLKIGKNTLTAKYLGSATVAASQDDFVIKVKKP